MNTLEAFEKGFIREWPATLEKTRLARDLKNVTTIALAAIVEGRTKIGFWHYHRAISIGSLACLVQTIELNFADTIFMCSQLPETSNSNTLNLAFKDKHIEVLFEWEM